MNQFVRRVNTTIRSQRFTKCQVTRAVKLKPPTYKLRLSKVKTRLTYKYVSVKEPQRKMLAFLIAILVSCKLKCSQTLLFQQLRFCPCCARTCKISLASSTSVIYQTNSAISSSSRNSNAKHPDKSAGLKRVLCRAQQSFVFLTTVLIKLHPPVPL